MNLLNSINDFNEAKAVIAGGVNSPVRAFGNVGGNPRFIKSGNGAFIIDEDNNQYIDFVQSWGPLILGHKDNDVMEAINEALKCGVGFGAPTVGETKLAKEIISAYEGIDKIRLVSSGTEATMSAIRLARGFSGRDDIIKFDGCYHGHSDSLLVSAGSGCATFGNPSSPGVPKDFSAHTLVARYNDLESLEACFLQSKSVACVIIEPIAGNMGLVPANIDFIRGVRALCDKFGSILIFDEVMSGFRASKNGALGLYGVIPDLVTFGKVIGGGLPLAAFGGRSDIMNLLSPVGAVYQAGTLSGNPIAVAAGYATLQKIARTPNLYEHLENLANKFINGLQNAAQKHGIKVQTSVRGSMFGYFFSENPVKNFDDAKQSNTELFAKFHAKMLENGAYIAPSMFESGFICAPMNDEIIQNAINAAEKSFEEII